jgi:hypothetical protein
MFTRHRHDPPDKLNCPHALGTNALSRMIPRLPLRLRSGLRQSRDFGSGLRRPLGALTFCCYHRPIRLLRCAQSLRAGSGCLPRTQADESSSQGGTSHPKIAKSAILGCGTQRSFRLQVYEYVVMPEHVHLLLSELQRDTSSDGTAPLKPKDGLNWDSVDADLRWPWLSGSAVPEIIAHYQAENEPSGAERTLQRTADLRFSDARVVADRDFNHAESGEGAF